MLSAIVASHESERSLVPTLAALVAGVTSGLLSEVVVADGGSRDATREVADIAGCRFISSDAPLGARLKSAAQSAKGSWLLFLPAGTVPASDWVDTAGRFIEDTERLGGASKRAASFRPPPAADLLRPALAEIAALVRHALGGVPRPEQGLLIARGFYDALGGHGDGADADAALLRQIGRSRISILSTAAAALRDT
jgi:glycosyltransferase involved in cell wall biosynthesis